MEWQPIETAPKDGTVIDVWVLGERLPDVKWHKGEWRHWGIDEFDGMDWVSFNGKPTHWMPLPSPPEAK